LGEEGSGRPRAALPLPAATPSRVVAPRAPTAEAEPASRGAPVPHAVTRGRATRPAAHHAARRPAPQRASAPDFRAWQTQANLAQLISELGLASFAENP
jgi:hypothetical protein